MRSSRSTPDLVGLAALQAPCSPPTPADDEVVDPKQPLCAVVTGASMELSRDQSMVVYYEVSVVVGHGARDALSGSKRRYREFLRLHRDLLQRYPIFFGEGDDGGGQHAELPPFPPKSLFRASWAPDLVHERVRGLGRWLRAVCELLQYASPELCAFLNVPLYCATRLLSGDLQRADLLEPCSPDTVMAEQGGVARHNSRDDSSAAGPLSPHVDQRSLPALATRLVHTVTRPGYNESALLVARAACSHAAAAGVSAPTADEACRLVRAVCGRALFKPTSLIAAVVYLDRLAACGALHQLLRQEGWPTVVVVVLVIAAKVWDSDYPISNADICAPASLPPAAAGGSRPTMRRVNECERRVLHRLNYATLVSPAEFARCYLTMPFAFPDVPLPSRLDLCTALDGGGGGGAITPQKVGASGGGTAATAAATAASHGLRRARRSSGEGDANFPPSRPPLASWGAKLWSRSLSSLPTPTGRSDSLP